MVMGLLKAGFKPEIQNNKKHPLILALETKQSEIAKLLLTEESIQCSDAFGNTPLHIATGENLVELIPLLIEKGLDPNAKNELGETPLAFSQNVESTELLIKLGADTQVLDNQGNNLLYEALVKNEPKLVSYYLQLGFDINAKNNKGDTPFHSFIKNAERTQWNEYEHSNWLSILEEVKKLDYDPTTPDSNQDSPLILATRNNLTELAEQILNKSNESIDFMNKQSATALCTALQTGNEKLVLEFLRNEADIYRKYRGTTYIEMALMKKMNPVIAEVIKRDNDKLKTYW